MHLNFLDFEQPIAELHEKIEELRLIGSDHDIDINAEIVRLEKQCEELTKSIFKNLKPIQIVQLARHSERPYLLDYLPLLFTDFEELFGDRHSAKGGTIVGGLGRFDGEPVMIIGHQKGRKTNDKIARNFGMARPEDYRKAQRLMQMAEKFHLPILTFIDTPGAYPGIDAEKHNQSEAIARNLLVMSQLKTPIICTVTGEGGSGGALAISVGDILLMLEYSIYSVISPEGCASILWRSAEKAPEAAEALGVTAPKLLALKLIDDIVSEPLGGAHRNLKQMADNLRGKLREKFKIVSSLSIEDLLARRYQRLMSYGREAQ